MREERTIEKVDAQYRVCRTLAEGERGHVCHNTLERPTGGASSSRDRVLGDVDGDHTSSRDGQPRGMTAAAGGKVDNEPGRRERQGLPHHPLRRRRERTIPLGAVTLLPLGSLAHRPPRRSQP